MIKTIARIDAAGEVAIDAALLELASLKVGDEVNVEVQPGGKIMITPMGSMPSEEEVSTLIKETMRQYSHTMKRLA